MDGYVDIVFVFMVVWLYFTSQPRVPGARDLGARQVVSELEVWKPWVLREVGSECFGLR